MNIAHAAAALGLRLRRTNYAGRPVTLAEGVAAVALAAVADPHRAPATVGIGLLGLQDDLLENPATRAKGLTGHFGQLRRGIVTTGALKALGIPVVAILDAAAAGVRDRDRARIARGSGSGTATPAPGTAAVDVLLTAGLVAGSANVVNLLDLRPGRALKAVAVVAAAAGLAAGDTGGRRAGLGTSAVALALLPTDLGESGMLGDAGANALGAGMGRALAAIPSRTVRVGALAVVAGLTLASERISFSAVIESHPVLRRIDRWGRRPAPDHDNPANRPGEGA